MAEDLPAPDVPKPRRRSPWGILRWLARFLALSTAVVASVLLLVAIVASVLYFNRVRLLNQTLAFLVAPFRVTVDAIDFTPLGTVRLENLRLAPKSAPPGSLLASIPEAVLTYRIAELQKTRRFENLTLRGATIAIDDGLLAAMASPEAEDGEAPAKEPFLLSRLALFTGTLAVEESRFLVDLDALPRLEGTWAFRSGSFDFEESGLSRTPFAWRISDLAIGPEGSDGKIAVFSGEGRVSADLLRFDLGPLRLERPVLRLTPSTLPRRPESGTEEGRAAEPPLSTPPPARSIRLRGIEVVEAELSAEGFDGADGSLLLPDFAFQTSFSLPDLSFADGRWESDGALAITLTEAQAGSGGLPFLSAASIHVEADSLQAIATERRIARIAFEKADFLASNETLARFLNKEKKEAEAADPDDPAQPPPSLPWVFETVELGPGAVLVRDLDVGGTKAPELSTAIRGTLRDLRFGGGEGFASEGVQSILLEQTRLRPPGAVASAEPLLSMERVELEGNWSDFQRENLVERLVVRGPKIEFTDAALGDWLKGDGPAPDDPRPVNRPVYKAKHLEATGGRLVADSSFATGRVPKVHADFSLETKPLHEGEPFSYRLQFDDFAIRNHARSVEPVGPPTPAGQRPTATTNPLAEGEVFRVAEIEVDFTAAGLQRTRRIDKLKIDGAVLTVGEGLKSIAEDRKEEEAATSPEPSPNAAAPTTAPTTAPSAPASGTARSLPAWTLGEVEITRSRVHFESLIPQVEGLQFTIETKLTDLPLSLDGILAQEAKQKIELAGIVIKDPYDSFITVAELPTIFVEFSLAGLARQEVERIDLVGPSLHVGQGLFWWVDYQRRFREQNEGASIGIESDAAARKPDWVIKTIDASAGKIVISPTGVPIGVVPFPFNATTNMSDGDIELKLNIPDENHVYRFPDYKVELEGLAGDVQFNVPVKDLNNNLVQTFSLRRAKWKDFDARDLYITATFDENGIYGNFGGEAYAGYAEGGFNFYLTDRGKWDAWVAGTNLDTGPVTKILVPDSFLMEGKVSLKVVSEGRDKTIGETTGEFQTTTPGWFDITKLDTVFEKLPPEWNSLQRSLTELSLVALKRFDYDKGAGSLYFLNRAGKLELRFTGDYGSRELNLHVHDQRNTNESADATVPEETPRTAPAPPEADARPARTARIANALKSR